MTSIFARQIRAFDYAYGINSAVTGIQVTSGPNASGSGTLTIGFGYFVSADGVTVTAPFNTNAPIIVGGSTAETVTPSSVSNTTPLAPNTCQVTATFASLHGNGDNIRSGTVGLQEALNYLGSIGGGTVIVDSLWVANGGTQAMINAATFPAGVSYLDNRLALGPLQSMILPLTITQIQNASTTAVLVVPAGGTGTFIDVIDATINYIFGTNAFGGGGAIQLSYGTPTTFAATSTWAVSLYTATSNQLQKVAGAAAASTSSNYLNKAIYYNNATAAFTGGTGSSAIVEVNYKVVGGLS